MDSNIRVLLTACQKNGESLLKQGKENSYLIKAHSLLKSTIENNSRIDSPELLGNDLLIRCAELSFQFGRNDITQDCLNLYFSQSPPSNQFLCRAYLCQAQLLAPTFATEFEKLDESVVYILKAINLAKNNPKYLFLVYNASVIYWKFCRPFLKTGYKQHLAQSLQQIVKALDDIDDADFEWRAQLIIALIECHIDAGRINDASQITSASINFIRTNVPDSFKQLFGLMVRYDLLDFAKYQKDLKISHELNIYHKICCLKKSLDKKEPAIEIDNQFEKIFLSLKSAFESFGDGVKSTKTSSNKKAKPLKTDKNTKVLDFKIFNLALEVARLALNENLLILCQNCVDLIHSLSHLVKDGVFLLELEFFSCEFMMKKLGAKQESYDKNIVEMRCQAIKRCNEALINALRLSNPELVQVGCITQWNLSLPLLQNNLRSYVRQPLILVSEALEQIQSLLRHLRCQVHIEVAKCVEDQEQVQIAIDHLMKAISLDDNKLYTERIEHKLNRLKFRSQLYTEPENLESQAAIIIEQVRNSHSGDMRMKRSLLVQAGQALAPDSFLLVLEGENQNKDLSGGKFSLNAIKTLFNRAKYFNECMSKVEGHLKRLGDERDKERACLWGDLAKAARKQGIWDVCRVTCRFCLLYDDNRWKKSYKESLVSPAEKTKVTQKEPIDSQNSSELSRQKIANRSTSQSTAIPPSSKADTSLFDQDLLRMMAEINFINGEALVHLLRSEGVEIGNVPAAPEDRSKRPKGYQVVKAKDDQNWHEYCDWINSLSDLAVQTFLRAATLGTDLNESWIVCSAGSYIWNYHNHVLDESDHQRVIEPMKHIINCMKTVGHDRETVLLVNMCNSLSLGLIQPWKPAERQKDLVTPSKIAKPVENKVKTPIGSPTGKKTKQQITAGSNSKSNIQQITISTDATPNLKLALEYCEYAIKITDGKNQAHLVPINVRLSILETWVLVKQMLQSQIGKSLGVDSEGNKNVQDSATKAIVAAHMIYLNSNGIMEFKDTPSLNQTATLIDEANCKDTFIQLKLWTKLSYLAFESNDHSIVELCANKASQLADNKLKVKSINKHDFICFKEFLSDISLLFGQSLMNNTQGKNTVRRLALTQFLNSVMLAQEASNGEKVLLGCRHFWNASLPLMNQMIERDLLKNQLTLLLSSMSETLCSIVKKIESENKEAFNQDDDENSGDGSANVGINEKHMHDKNLQEIDADLTLLASFYGVLFQCYADKDQWEEGLAIMDEAIASMPRTNHRLLIFKHLVVVKAKLGQSVHTSIAKFKDESEDYIAHMWRRVALSSDSPSEQLQAYQNSVEALTLPKNDWQKVDYLLEFGQWLYCNSFPLQDVLDQFEWAVDILMNMKFSKEVKDETKTKKRSRKNKPTSAAGKSSKTSRKLSDHNKSSQLSVDNSIGDPRDCVSVVSEDGSSVIPPVKSYIPVQKDILIGTDWKSVFNSLHELTDIRQLELLFRCHTLLAQVSGRDSSAHSSHLLMAYGFIMRIWNACISNSGPVLKELTKISSTDINDKSSAKGKKKDKEPVKEKPKRKGPLDAIPVSIEEWSVYDVPDEMIDAFSNELMKNSGINENTFKKPVLSIYYLNLLVNQLCDIGFHHLTLPILAFLDLLSRGIAKERSLNVLIHLRSMQICLELDITQGVQFHEKLTDFRMIPEEQTKSRNESSLWYEKIVQLSKEESRLKASMAQLESTLEMSATKQKKKVKSSSLGNNRKAPNEKKSPLFKNISKVEQHEVWTETAEALINQGIYQPAKDLLFESFQAATLYKDSSLLGKILYLLARISFLQGQYKQSVNFCTMAQEVFIADEMFMFNIINLMTDAILSNIEEKNNYREAKNFLLHSLDTFMELSQSGTSNSIVKNYVLAMLESKLSIVEISSTDDSNLSQNSSVFSSFKKLERSADKLTRLGYIKEACDVKSYHANILLKIARTSNSLSDKHNYYLMSWELLKEAVFLYQNMFKDISNVSIFDVKQISIPLQRMYCQIGLNFCELSLEILLQQVKEERNKQIRELRKSSVLRVVENLVCETPNYEDVEKKWIETCLLITDEILTNAEIFHNLAGSISELKAKSLYVIGRCLRLHSLLIGPDIPHQWHDRDSIVNQKVYSPTNSVDESSTNNSLENRLKEKSKKRHLQLLEKQKVELIYSHQYVAQASECLLQSLQIALQKGLVEICELAAIELVECFGKFEPAVCSQLLALHQSCKASHYCQNLLQKALLLPSCSQQAALFHQNFILRQSNTSSNATRGPTLKKVLATLDQSSLAWKNLEISPNHLDLIKDFPPNYTFVLLQHSSDKCHLYASILDKSKAVTKGSHKNTSVASGSNSRVIRVDVNGGFFEHLLEKVKRNKNEIMSILLRKEYKRSQQAQRQKMLSTLENSASSNEKRINLEGIGEEKLDDEKIKLQMMFTNVIAELEEYLRDFTEMFEDYFRSLQSNGETDRSLNKDKEASNLSEYFVLLADPDLLEFPLEALHVFQDKNIISVSRDLSLQMIHNKMIIEPLDEAAEKLKKEQDKNKPPSRIPGLRDASKKMSKIIPLDRPVAPVNLPVDTHSFRYIVDPHQDCSELEQKKPIQVFKDMVEEHNQQFTPRWLGVFGDEHTPSPGEYEIYLTESSGFIYYGMEKFLNFLQPQKLAALNLPDCSIAIIFDLVQTSSSFQRQGKIDVRKSEKVIELEKPVETSILLGLIGVNCVWSNQWHCTLQENGEKLETTMKDILERGCTSGQSIYNLLTPHRQKTGAESSQRELSEQTDPKQSNEKLNESLNSLTESSKTSSQIEPQHNWFNMVCYGAPNIMVTQLSKV